MIGVVCDTNTAVSANLKEHGPEAYVFRLVAARTVQLYVTEAVLAEYEEVLRRRSSPSRPSGWMGSWR